MKMVLRIKARLNIWGRNDTLFRIEGRNSRYLFFKDFLCRLKITRHNSWFDNWTVIVIIETDNLNDTTKLLGEIKVTGLPFRSPCCSVRRYENRKTWQPSHFFCCFRDKTSPCFMLRCGRETVKGSKEFAKRSINELWFHHDMNPSIMIFRPYRQRVNC